MKQTKTFFRHTFGALCILYVAGCGPSDSQPSPAPVEEEKEYPPQTCGDGKLVVRCKPHTVDLARDFFVTVTLTTPPGVTASLPDLRDRFHGFRVAEDFEEKPITDKDGNTTSVTRWRLEPDPAASGAERRRYRLKPFVVTTGDGTFYTEPVFFDPPAAREPVTGEIEIEATHDFPALTWRRVGLWTSALAGVLLVLVAAYFIFRKIRQIVRIHRMSPIERAFYELDRLLQKGLPGRGFYKDFYVELTMVVRRYIERRYGVRAPHLTTDEFLRAAGADPAFPQMSITELKAFLESADLVKFAGLEATPEMADGATVKARNYLVSDSQRKENTK